MRLAGLLKRFSADGCCKKPQKSPSGLAKIVLIGSPNVGKSAMFNRLTGRYVTVSNYPGTTVEISRGRSKILGGCYEVVDTPGMYLLSAITEEERVARTVLMTEKPHAVIHVVDAKNIERMLSLTLQLIEAGTPVILALNMADEARGLGIEIDAERLAKLLNIPVVETVATSGEGIAKLTSAIEVVCHSESDSQAPGNVDYGLELEPHVSAVAALLDQSNGVSARTRALLLLQDEPDEVRQITQQFGKERAEQLLTTVSKARSELQHSVHYHATLALKRNVERILGQFVSFPAGHSMGLRERLSRVCMHPLTGIPILFLVLYFGLYKFVGGFGAGTLVDFIEAGIFEEHINPWIEQVVTALVPWQMVQDLFVGEYGVFTLGVRYAVAIVLPIVATFFIAFSILEDSGYLPRLAMLIDRVFKKIGLNGRAVIPIVLGLGCATMATIVTRTLETKRERIIASFLLALAIPCSAQLGVILGLLSMHPMAVLIWAVIVGGVFLLAGTLTARLLPGRKPSFYMELPPLRLPKLSHVAIKTYSRMVWYFKEIFPLFILASVMIWLGEITGIFQVLIRGLNPVVNLMGLPDGASVAFLFGFFRRDYGAAGLFDLQKTQGLTIAQLTVAAVTLTLFLPCIAQFLILKKERGWRMAMLTATGIVVVAFVVGFATNAAFSVMDGLL